MDFKESKLRDIFILELIGEVDTRSAKEFEQKIVLLLESGARRFVVDFKAVNQLTSSGLRVLVMLAKSLRGPAEDLLFCSLNAHVNTVLEISGLTQLFRVFPGEQRDAVRELSRMKSQPHDLKLASLAANLLNPTVLKSTETTGKVFTRFSSTNTELVEQAESLLQAGREISS